MIDKNLIQRLRETASKGVSVWGDLLIEAANEIERMQQERERLLAGNGEPVVLFSANLSQYGLNNLEIMGYTADQLTAARLQGEQGGQIAQLLQSQVDGLQKLIEAKDRREARSLAIGEVNQQLLDDAKRYRWLREQPLESMSDATYRIINSLECQLLPGGEFFKTLDAAIDAAIAAAEGKQK